ncbi:MAG: nickel pincer cofactor biosynthesis protein LarC [Planctomycetes bacterium]|nr:nickel pincer cofactor biosynthesis protein LarC [Planctomycetota bacterium]
MKIAYFDCFAGAGGDMIAACLLDAGCERQFLTDQLDTLGIEGLKIEIEPAMRSGIAGLSFKPVAPDKQHHRNLSDITKMISESAITDQAKHDAIEIFNILADAEAKIHGKNRDEIHFHEVGAVDSIVDIVSAAIAMDAMKIDKVICSQLSVGGGTINIAHGKMPAPAPATVEILKIAGAPIQGGPVSAEVLTPTAAAILTHFADDYAPLPQMTIEAVGYGAGTMIFDETANILRVVIGLSADICDTEVDSVCLIETNVDDSSAEVIGYVTEKLLSAGALDVYTTSIQMKKNRPAVKISIIASHDKACQIEKILFDEQITLGIRRQLLQRKTLKRQTVSVETKFGKINIKIGLRDAEIISAKPEFSDCQKAAKLHDVPLKIVQKTALEAFAARNRDNSGKI